MHISRRVLASVAGLLLASPSFGFESAQTAASTCKPITIPAGIDKFIGPRFGSPSPALSEPDIYTIPESLWRKVVGKAKIVDLDALYIGWKLSDGRHVSFLAGPEWNRLHKFEIHESESCLEDYRQTKDPIPNLNLPVLKGHRITSIDRGADYLLATGVSYVTAPSGKAGESDVYLAQQFSEGPSGKTPARVFRLLRTRGIVATATSVPMHGGQSFVVLQKLDDGGGRLLFYALTFAKL